MRKNKTIININKIAKKINYLIYLEPDIDKMKRLRENIQLLNSQTAKQVLNKIIKIHEMTLGQLVSKAEYYQLTDNMLSYHSNQIAFQKENDLLTRLKTEQGYFNIAQQDLSKITKRYPRPVLNLSSFERKCLCELTNDTTLFDFQDLSGVSKLERLDQKKLEELSKNIVMIISISIEK